MSVHYLADVVFVAMGPVALIALWLLADIRRSLRPPRFPSRSSWRRYP
ncbi:MAG: hypothetical protein WC683_07090 [bacterium]